VPSCRAGSKRDQARGVLDSDARQSLP
jgi:hypothetical protein